MNRVTLIGNVGTTPESKTFENSKVVNISLATSESFTNKKGDKVEQTEWHQLEMWNNLAELAEKYIKKGDRLMVEGKVTYQKWTDNEGKDRYSTKIKVEKIEFMSSKKDDK